MNKIKAIEFKYQICWLFTASLASATKKIKLQIHSNNSIQPRMFQADTQFLAECKRRNSNKILPYTFYVCWLHTHSSLRSRWVCSFFVNVENFSSLSRLQFFRKTERKIHFLSRSRRRAYCTGTRHFLFDSYIPKNTASKAEYALRIYIEFSSSYIFPLSL